MKSIRKWWIGCWVALAGAGMAAGNGITLEQAETAVGNWAARGGAFGQLANGSAVSGETFEDPDTGAKMHVVRVPGRGFAVTSDDDGIEPIILFSDGDEEFVAEEGNPLWDLLRWDLAARKKALDEASGTPSSGTMRKDGSGGAEAAAARAKWAELLSEPAGLQKRGNGEVGIRIWSIRRWPLLKTSWNQTEGSLGSVYNMYTPGKTEVTTVGVAKASARAPKGWVADALVTNEVGHYPVGCVAVAGGQVMNYWQYPTSSVPAMTVTCRVDGVSRPLAFHGTFVGDHGERYASYEWEGMGGSEPGRFLPSERVSRLLSDIGVMCEAHYTAAETSMAIARLASRLESTYGYANAVYHTANLSGGGLKQVLIPNLDAGAPVVLGIGHAHAVVADGYGFNSDESTFYVHINLGWGQATHYWYVPPDIDRYSSIDEILCNVFPGFTGVVLSGRVTGPHNRPVYKMNMVRSGTSAGAAETSTDGIYRFLLAPGSYTVTPTAPDGTVAVSAKSIVLAAMSQTVNGNRILDFQAANVKTVGDIAVGTVSPRGAKELSATFSEPFSATLSCPTDGCEIHYTLDGSAPRKDDPLYVGPITINDTTTLRAVAYADGMECSDMFEITYTFVDSSSRDDFADARPVSGSSGRSSFDNSGYTKETGEPTHSSGNWPGGASAWAKWTAPADGDWTVWLEGTGTNGTSALDTQLAIYTGEAVGMLTRVAANDDTPAGGYSSRLSFHAESGTEYKIAMDTYGGAAGRLVLRWEPGWVDWVNFEYTPQWVPASGGKWGMKVDASAGWNVGEHSDWIGPLVHSGESGGPITYEVSTNSAGSERSGYVTVQAGNSEFASLTVRQHPMEFVTTKADALDRAWRENKRILLVRGRETCGNTSATLFSSIPSASVRSLVEDGFVLWYSNCDRQSDGDAYSAGSYLPTVAIIDPLDPSKSVAATTGYQSASALQSLLQSAPTWPGLPLVQFAVKERTATSATVTTKMRTWAEEASTPGGGQDTPIPDIGTQMGWSTSAWVELETGDDKAFASGVSTQILGTIAQLWTEQAWTFGPPSETEAAFCRIRVSSGGWSEVSDVVEFIPLGVALDDATFAFSSAGVAEWRGQTAESHDGVDAARCAIEMPAGTNGWVEASLKTSVKGPGRLAFWWKGAGNYGNVELRVDNQYAMSLSVTNRVWEEACWNFAGTSEHEVKWVLRRYNSTSPAYNATGWVDQVTWTPEEVVPLASALDNDVLAFSSDGDESWLGQTAESHDGVDAARCAIEMPSGTNYWGTASLKTSVTGPGRLSFWWKGGGNYGNLGLRVDKGLVMTRSVTNRDWEEVHWKLADTSEHEVEWVVYRLNYYLGPYYNATGWVDQVTWTPGAIVTLDRQGGWNGTGAVLAFSGETLGNVACPNRPGYTFGGYYAGTNGTGTQYYTATGESVKTWDGAEDSTLYAKWIPATYTVTLDRQGGEGGTSSVTATYLETLPSITPPTRPGYDFGGYYTGQEGTGTRYYNAAGVGLRNWYLVSDTVLYARWIEQTEVTWSFRIENGVAIVTGASPLRGRLEIPATLGGCPVGEIGAHAFEDERNLMEAIIPGWVTNIGSGAFSGCINLESVTISEGVRIIGADSFSGCHNLTSVLIPSSVEEICRGCNGVARTIDGLNLVAIEVAPGNAVYASEDGVLFSKDKHTLLGVPRGKAGEYVIPDGVTSIAWCAFAYNSGLTSVIIPDSVTFIGQEAFGWCRGFTSLVIPESVTTIAYYAFWNSSLTSLVIPDSVTYFGGGACGACYDLARLEVPGDWWGTDMVEQSEVLTGCEVVYRGINPLVVATDELPVGMKGEAYQTTLEASGGISPYAWNWETEQYEETNSAGSYTEMGTAQGWQESSQCWDLALPFAFPFFGNSYTNAKINSNCAISFGTNRFAEAAYSQSSFLAAPIIAVLWGTVSMTDGDIYVTSGFDAVTIQWRGKNASASPREVNVSATLKKDGTVVLKYGEGNRHGGRIGISAGDGATALFSAKSLSGSMENAQDIVFRPVDERLPPGLSLTEDGVIQGVPTAVGEFAFTVVATDAKGVTASKRLVLSVAPVKTTETTPVGVPWNWLEQKASDILAAHGGDYEAAAKAPTANGKPVWECYVAGLSTTVAEAEFKVKSIALVDGEVQIEWEPDLNDNGTPTARTYIVQGKPTMTNDWGFTNASSRFFRVLVKMPE